MPYHQYAVKQSGFTWYHRKKIVAWFFRIQAGANLPDETVWGAVNILDRLLEVRLVPLDKVEVVALSSFTIAAKYEMVMAPTFEDMLRITELDASVHQMCKYEVYILKVRTKGQYAHHAEDY